MITHPPPSDSKPATFETLFAERWEPMVKLATLTTGSIALGEEIAQDAFEQLHRNWNTVEHPRTWLRTAVVNRSTDWVRRQGIERRHTPEATEPIAADEGIAMREALKAVTPRQRTAIVLRYYEDLPEAEIAELLGCRPGTVKSLLSRGLRTLRKELQP